MIVRKTRRLTARMGQYETHEVIGDVTLDTNNEDDKALIDGIGGPGLLDGPISTLDVVLQELMATDVEEAAFNTADEDSFIHEFHKNNTTNRKK